MSNAVWLLQFPDTCLTFFSALRPAVLARRLSRPSATTPSKPTAKSFKSRSGMPIHRSRSRSSSKRRPLANFDLPSMSMQLRHGVKAVCRTQARRLTTPRTATSLNSTLAPQPTYHSRVSAGLNLLFVACRAVTSTAVCHIRVPANSLWSRSTLLPEPKTPLMRRGLAPRRPQPTLARLTLPTLLLSRTKPPACHCFFPRRCSSHDIRLSTDIVPWPRAHDLTILFVL